MAVLSVSSGSRPADILRSVRGSALVRLAGPLRWLRTARQLTRSSCGSTRPAKLMSLVIPTGLRPGGNVGIPDSAEHDDCWCRLKLRLAVPADSPPGTTGSVATFWLPVPVRITGDGTRNCVGSIYSSGLRACARRAPGRRSTRIAHDALITCCPCPLGASGMPVRYDDHAALRVS
jgi:hypothetical protein